MTPLAVGFGIGLCAMTGLALMFAVRSRRLRRECARLDAAGLEWHRRHDARRDETAALGELVHEYGPAILDTARRYNFDVPDALRAWIGWPSSEAVSWWLFQRSLRATALSEGQRATESFRPASNGWRPPKGIAERAG